MAEPRLRDTKHLGPVAFLVLGVPVTLKASRLEFRCKRGDPLPAQLRARRRRLGLTTTEAAALVGVTQWTLGMWENARQKPSARSRRALAKFLGCKP
ncbi:helix-turn-helix transcriptional regulator [Phenylobacterium sp.]|uniref:helix-turn-helix transcriptional regulator n=1 Tax=Phenylobacterium sp. TaxID=1871053 RepID=UPI00374D0C3D